MKVLEETQQYRANGYFAPGMQPRFQSWGSNLLVWRLTALLQKKIQKDIPSLAQSVTPTRPHQKAM